MSKKPESVFRARFDKFLKQIPKSFFISVQQASLSGHPDKVGTINGYGVFLELKRKGLRLKLGENGATKLQNYHLSKFRMAGAYAEVVRPENYERVLVDLMQLANGEKTPDELQKETIYG